MRTTILSSALIMTIILCVHTTRTTAAAGAADAAIATSRSTVQRPERPETVDMEHFMKRILHRIYVNPTVMDREYSFRCDPYVMALASIKGGATFPSNHLTFRVRGAMRRHIDYNTRLLLCLYHILHNKMGTIHPMMIRQLFDLTRKDFLYESWRSHWKRKVQERSNFFCNNPQMIRSDPKFALMAIKKFAFNFQYCPPVLRNNEKIAMAAVQKEGRTLRWASSNLKDNFDIVLAAALEDSRALQYASARLRNDRTLVLRAVQKDGCALHYASKEMKANREVVLAAVRHTWSGSEFVLASAELKRDRDIVLTAVRMDPSVFEFVPEELQQDLEVKQAAGIHLTIRQKFLLKLEKHRIFKWLNR